MARCFHAMGTLVTVLVPGASAEEAQRLALRVQAAFEHAEQRYSRFRPDSELARLNAARGPVVVSAELFTLLHRCMAAMDWTGGLFDPGVGAALVAMGYDRPFSPGALDHPEGAVTVAHGLSLRSLRMDPTTRTVLRPAGLHIDLGGLAKSATVDAVGAMLPAVSAVDAGGDMRLNGAGPEGRGWVVEVEDPWDPTRVVHTLTVSDGAVATSGRARRHWTRGGESVHHLVDPRTGQASRSDLMQVTVVGRTVADAELMARTAFLLGRREGLPWLTGMSPRAWVAIDRQGGIHTHPTEPVA